jgi:hypothetical protein
MSIEETLKTIMPIVKNTVFEVEALAPSEVF